MTEHQGREESPKRTQVKGHRSKDRRRRQSSHSLPRNIYGGYSDAEDISEPAPRGRRRQKEKKNKTERRSKSEDRRRQPKSETEEETQGEEEQHYREWERKKMDMSIRKQRFEELSKKWDQDEKERLENKKSREIENSLFLKENYQKEESSWGKLGSGPYGERRNGQELQGESKSETKQMLPDVQGKEKTWQWDVITQPYFGKSLPGQEKVQSNYVSAHESNLSPFSFLMSHKHPDPESETSAMIPNTSDASVQKFSTHERYRSGAKSTIVPGPWLKSSLLTSNREVDRNRLTGRVKDQAMRENPIT